MCLDLNFHKAPSDSTRNMKATVLLVVISLLGLCETQEDHRIYVRPGEDLLLQVNTLVKNSTNLDFSWKLYKQDDTLNIIKVMGDVTTLYEKRAELKENYALLLRNLNHHDNGTYKAILSDKKDTTLAEYIVFIQDPVSPVNLTVSSNSNSSDCVLNASCSPEYSNKSITFTCDMKKCLRESDDNLFGSIVVFVQGNHIICNYSNQVSWKQHKVDIGAYCGDHSKSQPSSGVNLTAIVLGTAFGVSVLLAVLIYHSWKCKRKNQEKTASPVPREINLDQTPLPNSAGGASKTTDALVESCPRPTESNAREKESKPESVYAVVQKVTHPRAATAVEDE